MEENKNKFQPDKRIFSLCVYAIITTVICSIFIRCIWNWESTKQLFSGLFSSLSPFLVGFFIAYIMSNISTGIEKHFFKNTLKIKNNSANKILSLITSYLIVLILIGSALFFIVPSFLQSISDMAGSVTGLYNKLVELIDSLSEQYPNPTVDYVQNAIQDSMPKYIDYFRDWATGLAPRIANTSMSIVKWIFNLVVAVIVSVYMILDKDILITSLKKIIYSLFNKNKAEYVCHTLRRASDIFSGFIIGKTIDSLIIGMLCLIFMRLFNIGGSYILIISVFVGLTNMIPYFGPFIGAIPSAIIILLSVSPNQAFAFVVLIIVLQQFDGNILGPYILGDKTGLRPIWIIFAITVGGWLGGVLGMFLGVPCVAVISFILNDIVDRRLKERNISISENHTKNQNKNDKKIKTQLMKKISILIKNANSSDKEIKK